MTDRHLGYLVTLEQPTREDDAEATLAAIRQIRGVIDVRPVVSEAGQMAVAIRRDREWQEVLQRLVVYGPGPREEQP